MGVRKPPPAKKQVEKKAFESIILPGVQVLCPLSGCAMGGSKIKPHSILVRWARNGSITGFCRLHAARVFVADADVIYGLSGEIYRGQKG